MSYSGRSGMKKKQPRNDHFRLIPNCLDHVHMRHIRVAVCQSLPQFHHNGQLLKPLHEKRSCTRAKLKHKIILAVTSERVEKLVTKSPKVTITLHSA